MRRLIGVISPPYPSMDVYEDDGVESVCVDIIPDPANPAEAGYRLGREVPCGLGGMRLGPHPDAYRETYLNTRDKEESWNTP